MMTKLVFVKSAQQWFDSSKIMTVISKNKRYVLHPGNLINHKTGDSTRVSAPTLAKLYGVNLDECVVLNTHGKAPFKRKASDLSGFTHLYPRADGDYNI